MIKKIYLYLQALPEFDFSAHKYFPVVKIIWPQFGVRVSSAPKTEHSQEQMCKGSRSISSVNSVRHLTVYVCFTRNRNRAFTTGPKQDNILIFICVCLCVRHKFSCTKNWPFLTSCTNGNGCISFKHVKTCIFVLIWMKILSLKHFSILSYLAQHHLRLVALQRYLPGQVTISMDSRE